jgi:hypothetical protein
MGEKKKKRFGKKKKRFEYFLTRFNMNGISPDNSGDR